eukprot:IDg9391t1
MMLQYRLCPLWFSINWQESERERRFRKSPKGYVGYPLGDDWETYHDDVCFLNVLARDTLPWDVPVKPGAGADIQPLLAYPILNIPAAAADKPVNASERTPVPAADVATVGGVSSTRLVVAVSPTAVVYLQLDPVALDEVLRECFPNDDAVGYINADDTSEELNEITSDFPFALGNAQEESVMVRGASTEVPRGQKRRMSIDVDDAPAAQRSRVVDGAHVDKPTLKKVSDTPAPISIRVSLDRRYEYAVVVRAEGIDVVPVVGGEAGGFPFTDADATRPAKTVVVIRRPGRKTGRRSVRTSNPESVIGVTVFIMPAILGCFSPPSSPPPTPSEILWDRIFQSMRVTDISMSLALLCVERGGQRTHAFSYISMALWSAMDDLPLTPWTFSDIVNQARPDIALISAWLRFFGEAERILVLDRVLRQISANISDNENLLVLRVI